MQYPSPNTHINQSNYLSLPLLSQSVQGMVVALLEDISKGLDDSSNMPTQEAHAEMEDAKVPYYAYNWCLFL